jgi:hypothetical protein
MLTRHQLYFIILLVVITSLLSCNENIEGAAKRNQKLSRGDSARLKDDTLMVADLGHAIPVLNDKTEDSLLRAVASLPTVLLRNAYMHEKTGGKRQLRYIIDHRPSSDSPYYVIAAFEDNGDFFVTHFHFYYFTQDRQFKLYNTVTDHLDPLDPEDSERWEAKKQSCTYMAKFNTAQRMAKYPFSVAQKVRLISFRAHLRRYPFKEDQVVEDSVVESKLLSKYDTQKLTDIIYNNFYYGRSAYGVASQCFHPRHAIVFYNATGVVEAYVLICFHCRNYRPSSDKVSFGDECSDKTEKIRKFFIQNGVRFGTDLNQDHFPGEDDEQIVPAGEGSGR